MTKIWQAISTLQEKVINHEKNFDHYDKKFDHYDGIIEWIVKLVIGTIILAILAVVIKTKI